MQRRENEGGNAQNIAKGVLVSELSLGNDFALQRCVLQFALLSFIIDQSLLQ